MDLHCCTLCPRMCRADRYAGHGFCGEGAVLRAAKAYPHMWEEPCLSGTRGAGTVFFTGCSLGCIYCQNFRISQEGEGREITPSQLADIFLRLRDRGVHNIELVTPTHFLPLILDALDMSKDRLGIPVVYNSGGYERTETLRALEGYIDIYLPDVKYFSPDISAMYSSAPDYFEYAFAAVKEMVRQTDRPRMDEDGIMQSGVIVRHMIIPSHRRDSEQILRALSPLRDDVLLSLMSQYTPFYRAKEYHGLDRRLSTYEYEKVLEVVNEIGFEGYMQERSSAREEYTPDFSEPDLLLT